MHFMFLRIDTEPHSCSVTSCTTSTWQKGPWVKTQGCSTARNSLSGWALPQRSYVGRCTFPSAASHSCLSIPKLNPWSKRVEQSPFSLLENKGTTAGWRTNTTNTFNYSHNTTCVLISFPTFASRITFLWPKYGCSRYILQFLVHFNHFFSLQHTGHLSLLLMFKLSRILVSKCSCHSW